MAPISFDGDEVHGVTIDGDEVYEVTMDGDVVWTRVATFEPGAANGMAFSPDSSRFAVGGSAGVLAIYDTSDWSFRRTVTADPDGDGVTPSHERTIIWEPGGTAIFVGTRADSDGWSEVHAIVPDGWTLYSGWQVFDTDYNAVALSVSKNRQYISFASGTNFVARRYAGGVGTISSSEHVEQFPGAVRSAHFNYDGSKVAVASSNVIRIIDTETWDTDVEMANPDTMANIMWSPNGDYFAISDWGNNVRVFEGQDPYAEVFTDTVGGSAYALDWDGGQNLLAYAEGSGGTGKVYLRDVDTWDLVDTLQVPGESIHVIETIRFSPDGQYLAVGDWGNELIALYEPEQAEPRGPLPCLKINSTDDPTTAGEAVTVNVEIGNGGYDPTDISARLEDPSGTLVDETDTRNDVGPGDYTTEELSWQTSDGDVGSNELTAYAYDGSTGYNHATTTVTVEAALDLVDSFEDGDLSEYTTSAGSASVSSSVPSYDGDYSLVLPGGSTTQVVSESGLDNYPAPGGDPYNVHFYLPDASDGFAYLIFGYQDSGSFYYMFPRMGNNSWRLRKVDGGHSGIAQTSYSFNSNTWYRAELDWGTDGTIAATLYDAESGSEEASISANDSDYGQGGIGFLAAGVPDDMYVDYCYVGDP